MTTQTDHSYPILSPYLAVKNAAAAIDFYKKALGATERFRLTDTATGIVGHAEIEINGGFFMLSEENPAWNQSPETLGGTPMKLCLMVENADQSMDRALAAGATVIMPVSDQFYGFRSGSIRDPYGHEWMIQHEIEKVSPEEMQRRWDAMIKDCNATQEP